MLKPATMAKLNRIAGLFGSDHAGERAAAALAAHRLLEAEGLTWKDVLGRALVPEPKVVVRRDYDMNHVQAAESRIRQLKAQNMALERQVKGLRTRLNGLVSEERKARQQDEWLEDGA